MNSIANYIDIKDYRSEGYSRVVEYDAWTVASINYSDNFCEKNFSSVSRHNETDETFILTKGSATLIVGELNNLFRITMDKFKFYNVKKGTWHALFVSEDANVIVVENSNTGSENSDKSSEIEFSGLSCDKNISRDLVDIKEYTGRGYSRVIEYDKWTAAMINYSENFDENNFKRVERHNMTDEVFILIEGSASLMVGEPDSLVRVDMEKYKFYNVKKGAWHHVFLSENAKVVIAENSNTGSHNSELFEF
ncbi:MAG: hypothetical protein II998_05040 [Clostridia bacterium]|nr:hypothetical protein [Clostridia bacterium]